MDLAFAPEDAAFRAQVRTFLAEKLPARLRYKVENGVEQQYEDMLEWHHILAKQGWVAPNWPAEYGGPGWTLTQKYIFDEEMGLAGAPRIVSFGINMCGPVLMAFGTAEQKQRHLPPMLAGKKIWCQGYSEPGAGSDLASLKTEAVRAHDEEHGDHYVVNGSKIWTTKAHWADWVFLLVRTGKFEKRQQGISFLLVDMKTPGIEIRPIHLIDGLHETNQVFYTDVRVPVANRVGEEHEGWTIAKYLLAHERMGGGSLGQHKALLRQLKHIAGQEGAGGGAPMLEDPAFAREVASVEIELGTLEAFNLRAIDKVGRAGDLGAQALGMEANVFKIRNTEIQQRLTELKVQALGYYANPYVFGALTQGWNEPPIGAEYANGASPAYFHFRKVSIYSGSNEIQHNIIAKAELGL